MPPVMCAHRETRTDWPCHCADIRNRTSQADHEVAGIRLRTSPLINCVGFRPEANRTGHAWDRPLRHRRKIEHNPPSGRHRCASTCGMHHIFRSQGFRSSSASRRHTVSRDSPSCPSVGPSRRPADPVSSASGLPAGFRGIPSPPATPSPCRTACGQLQAAVLFAQCQLNTVAFHGSAVWSGKPWTRSSRYYFAIASSLISASAASAGFAPVLSLRAAKFSRRSASPQGSGAFGDPAGGLQPGSNTSLRLREEFVLLSDQQATSPAASKWVTPIVRSCLHQPGTVTCPCGIAPA